MWRSRVACPDRFSAQTSEFLDKHHLQGKITKTGTFILKNPVGELVPYGLLPLRVKKAVNLMPLSRDKIKKLSAFKSSLVNLYIYLMLTKQLLLENNTGESFDESGTWIIQKQ